LDFDVASILKLERTVLQTAVGPTRPQLGPDTCLTPV